MNGDFVVISYLRSPVMRIYHLLTYAEAKEFWNMLAQPLRDSAIVMDASHSDLDRGQRSWSAAAQPMGYVQ